MTVSFAGMRLKNGRWVNTHTARGGVIMYCLIVENGKTSRELNITANTRKRALELRAAYLRKIVVQGISQDKINIKIIEKNY